MTLVNYEINCRSFINSYFGSFRLFIVIAQKPFLHFLLILEHKIKKKIGRKNMNSNNIYNKYSNKYSF